jgi:hypothetical protein
MQRNFRGELREITNKTRMRMRDYWKEQCLTAARESHGSYEVDIKVTPSMETAFRSWCDEMGLTCNPNPHASNSMTFTVSWD